MPYRTLAKDIDDAMSWHSCWRAILHSGSGGSGSKFQNDCGIKLKHTYGLGMRVSRAPTELYK